MRRQTSVMPAVVYLIITAALFLSVTSAANSENKAWNTLYSYSKGKIYLHLKDNSLVSLNFSITGFDNLSHNSDYTESEIDYKNGQSLDTLSNPPANSSLFLFGDNLYAFTADENSSQDTEDTDLCGSGLMKLVKYNEDSNNWAHIKDLSFEDVNDASFYQYSAYLASPIDNSTLYIYGGYCENSDEPTDRLLSFDFAQLKFSNITTSTKPQPFFGASNLLAPNPQTQLVIGGESKQGWLNMYQLATWDFSSGWSFKQIEESETKINSRKFGLALPIFNELNDNELSTFSDYYNVEEVILIGGELLETDSTPTYAKLQLDSNEWSWLALNDSILDYDQIEGAATIFKTLIVVNSSSSDNSKRQDASKYQINLYDTSKFTSVDSIKENTLKYHKSNNAKTSEQKTQAIQKKAILGTVIPVAALALAAAAGFFIIKRRRRSKDTDELETIDYQLGNFYDHQSLGRLSGLLHHTPNSSKSESNFYTLDPSKVTSPEEPSHHKKVSRSHDGIHYGNLDNHDVYRHENDTNSTIDVASIDSWVKKRQMFDEQRQKYPHRNSYLASNETLHNDNYARHSTHLSPDMAQPLSDPEFTFPSQIQSPALITDEDPFNDLSLTSPNGKSFEYQRLASQRSTDQIQTPSGQANDPEVPAGSIVGRSVSRLKKTFSYSQTPPGSPILKTKRSFGMIRPPARSAPSQTLAGDRITEHEEKESATGRRCSSLVPEAHKRDSKSVDITNLGAVDDSVDDRSSRSSLYDKMDVQVLVSSKRRSKLRVVNPDLSDDYEPEEQIPNHSETVARQNQSRAQYELDAVNVDEINEFKERCDETFSDGSVRKRVPSGEKGTED